MGSMSQEYDNLVTMSASYLRSLAIKTAISLVYQHIYESAIDGHMHADFIINKIFNATRFLGEIMKLFPDVQFYIIGKNSKDDDVYRASWKEDPDVVVSIR